MGLLCDYFIAPTSEAAAAVVLWPSGPSVPPTRGRLIRRPVAAPLPSLSLPGIEPTMWMMKLEEVLTGRTFDDMLATQAAHPLASERGGQLLVVALSENLQRAVTELADEALPAVAVQWAAEDEDYGTAADPADAEVALRDLRALFRMASQQLWRCYCWVCV